MNGKTMIGCPLSCRPIVKVFIVRDKMFRRSPDDLPWRVCIGSKEGGAMTVARRTGFFSAMKARALVLDWLDTEDGRACYEESLKMLLGGMVLGDDGDFCNGSK